MKKTFLKSIFISLAIFFCAVLILTNLPLTAKAVASDFDCTLSAAPVNTTTNDPNEYMQYGCTDVFTYTAEQAAAAGVPSGCEGTVVKVVGDSPCIGARLDFSAKKIPINLVESLTVRFYIETHEGNGSGKPQLRIPKPLVGGHWVYQPGSTASVTGQWASETIERNDVFYSLADENGFLGKTELCLRSNVILPLYIDSIKVNLYQDDGVAPVLTYNGEDSITLPLNSTLMLDVSAYDTQEKCNKDVEYVWGNGVELDGNGMPTTKGNYTLILRAKDYYGNVSEKQLNVTVIEPYFGAPTIHLNFSSIHAQVGAMPILNVKATSAIGIKQVVKVWSVGALDELGRLKEGNHTYTITAIDTAGNETVKTINAYVTVNEPTYDNLIDENELSGFVIS